MSTLIRILVISFYIIVLFTSFSSNNKVKPKFEFEVKDIAIYKNCFEDNQKFMSRGLGVTEGFITYMSKFQNGEYCGFVYVYKTRQRRFIKKCGKTYDRCFACEFDHLPPVKDLTECHRHGNALNFEENYQKGLDDQNVASFEMEYVHL